VARLCRSIPFESVQVTLGSVRYHLDRSYFRKCGVNPDQYLFDLCGGIKPNVLRRLAKSIEYLVNLSLLGLRLVPSRLQILHVQYLPFLERGWPFEIWFLKLVRRRGIKVICTVHNVTRQDSPESGIQLFRRLYGLADALICHGEQARRRLVKEFNIAPRRVWLIPHGPLFEEYVAVGSTEARARLKLEQTEPLFLCFGVISEYKGIPFLLEAWKKMKLSRVGGRLLIAGTGDRRVIAEILSFIAKQNMTSSVDLRLEFVSVEELPLYHQAADVLVYPYKAGSTSGALQTGLNYGKAILATRLPLFVEQLGDCGCALFVDYGDVESMARALQLLIEQPHRRVEMAAAARRLAMGQSQWEEIARTTRQCYDAVLSG
jgi:glycosyltransferase involved in cell wall biosynthesis